MSFKTCPSFLDLAVENQRFWIPLFLHRKFHPGYTWPFCVLRYTGFLDDFDHGGDLRIDKNRQLLGAKHV